MLRYSCEAPLVGVEERTDETPFAFFGGFSAFDAFLFLQFLFEDFGEDFSSFGEEELVEIVKSFSVSGLVHDLIAVVEQGFETLHEQSVISDGEGNWGCINTSM